MTAPPLACTVRDCGLWLERRDAVLRCARGHSFDVSRRGYVNLLQPHDRRSLDAGDSAAAVAARAALLERGVGRTILKGVVDRAAGLAGADAVVVDLGCGAGDALAAIHQRTGAAGVGIDLSPAAAERAARRYRDLTWIVANADRRLPLLDRSVDLVVTMHGRRNPVECARVLTAQGRLLVAVPAADDLIELREAVQGAAVARDRRDALRDEYAPLFSPIDALTLREHHHLERDALQELLRGTYRGERAGAAERLQAIETLAVTVASEVIVFGRAS